MKRFSGIFSAAALVGLFTLNANAGVLLGVKGGIGIVTQDIVPDAESAGVDISTSVAPSFSGTIGYAIGEQLVVGLLVEYQMIQIDAGMFGADVTLGDAHSFSVFPFIEWHFIGKSRGISPYLSLAAGMNINNFDVDEDIARASSSLLGLNYDIELDDTFGFKGAFGADFFITEGLAANLELGWKYNKGDAREKFSGVEVSEGDFNASNFMFTGGLRYYF
jgi:outer membrane protein W